MERYRSGHNEAVLKTVCPQGRVGSNPTLSVEYDNGTALIRPLSYFFCKAIFEKIRRSTQAGRRDTPGKGAGR